MIGRKQAQITSGAVDGIERREKNTSINLTWGHSSNCTEVSRTQRRGGARIPHYWKWVFQRQEVGHTWDQQRGEHCIHDPVHSDTYPRDETRVVGGGLVPQGWYCPWSQLHRKCWVQECSDLIKHLLENGETDKWKKSATRRMGISEETTTGVRHLYTVEKTGTDHQKWERTRMEGISAFPLPDLPIDLSVLHRHKIPHPDLHLVPLSLVSLLRHCAECVSSWLAWGGAIIDCGGDYIVCCRIVFFQLRKKPKPAMSRCNYIIYSCMHVIINI